MRACRWAARADPLMRPLRLFSSPKIVGIFTDIDDTLTTGGRITPDALQALADLKAAGLLDPVDLALDSLNDGNGDDDDARESELEIVDPNA